jgi:hypothetical protein
VKRSWKPCFIGSQNRIRSDIRGLTAASLPNESRVHFQSNRCDGAKVKEDPFYNDALIMLRLNMAGP